MDPMIAKQLTEDVTYRQYTKDNRGDPAYEKTTHTIKGYIVYRTKLVTNLQGDTITSTISIYVNQDGDSIIEGDMVKVPLQETELPVVAKDRYSLNSQFGIGVIYL